MCNYMYQEYYKEKKEILVLKKYLKKNFSKLIANHKPES